MDTPDEKKKKSIEHKLASLVSGKKLGIKYKDLMKEMQQLTGYQPKEKQKQDWIKKWETDEINSNWEKIIMPLQNNYGNYGVFDSGFNYQSFEKQQKPLIVFFGFNGMLAKKYSVVSGKSHEEIMVRLEISENKVPYSIKNYDDFLPVIQQMQGTAETLQEIGFDDALNIIRIGIQKLQVEEFEDAEQDEFDDNCEATCKPGQHTCGK